MKVTGPMFSLSASGSIGGVVTAATWKGRPYFRQLVKPSNPKSAGQTATRAMWKYLTQVWNQLTTGEKSSYEVYANGTNITPFNAFLKWNMARWSQDAGPQWNYDATEAGTVSAGNLDLEAVGVKQVTFNVGVNPDPTTDVSIVIYRSTTTGFTPQHTNAVGVVFQAPTTTAMYIDTGLISGTTYYYKSRCSNNTGKWGAYSAQATATPN